MQMDNLGTAHDLSAKLSQARKGGLCSDIENLCLPVKVHSLAR